MTDCIEECAPFVITPHRGLYRGSTMVAETSNLTHDECFGRRKRKKWEQYWEYHESLVTDDKLTEMQHSFHTNRNGSLNMRNAEVALKHKNFSRTPSLNWRIQNVIGVHNAGYAIFYSNVMKYLGIEQSKPMIEWLNNKDKMKIFKKRLREMPINKRKRVYKRENKCKEELMKDRMKDPKIGTYGSGIGVHGKPPQKRKINVRKNVIVVVESNIITKVILCA